MILLMNVSAPPYATISATVCDTRFEDGDVHGLRNVGDAEFVYLSVTAPPIDFAYAYRGR